MYICSRIGIVIRNCVIWSFMGRNDYSKSWNTLSIGSQIYTNGNKVSIPQDSYNTYRLNICPTLSVKYFYNRVFKNL